MKPEEKLFLCKTAIKGTGRKRRDVFEIGVYIDAGFNTTTRCLPRSHVRFTKGYTDRLKARLWLLKDTIHSRQLKRLPLRRRVCSEQ